MSPYMFLYMFAYLILTKFQIAGLRIICTDSTEISFLRSAGLKVRERAKNYHLSKLSYFTDPYCAGGI